MKDKLRRIAIPSSPSIGGHRDFDGLYSRSPSGSGRSLEPTRVLQAAEGSKSESIQPPPGMTRIPGVNSLMGNRLTCTAFPTNAPHTKCTSRAFGMDETRREPTLNSRKFVEATSYVTTAEKKNRIGKN